MPASPRASPSNPGGSADWPTAAAGGAATPSSPPARPACSASRRWSGVRRQKRVTRSGCFVAVVRRMPAWLDDSPLAVALDLALELRDELVDRHLHVGRRLARTQRRALGEDGRLGHVVLGD